MRYSTQEGDEIDVYVSFGPLNNDADQAVEFDEVTLSIRDNRLEGRLRSSTDDETIAELGNSDRQVRIEVESEDGTETPVVETQVTDASGELEVIDVE